MPLKRCSTWRVKMQDACYWVTVITPVQRLLYHPAVSITFFFWALLTSKLSFSAVCWKQKPFQILDQVTETIAGTLYNAVLLFRSKRNSGFPIEVTSNPAVFRKWGDGCWHAVVVTALVSRLHCTRWWFQLSLAFLIRCLVQQPPPFTYATARGCAVTCSKSLVWHRLKIIFQKEEPETLGNCFSHSQILFCRAFIMMCVCINQLYLEVVGGEVVLALQVRSI